jgi:23S rRNA (uridine2552-2'-O)-methyltransferase
LIYLKNPKKRTAASRQWLLRQLNDPYVQAAKAQGYRSRAAFKLEQLDDQFHFFKKGQRVVDLGAAPGGWSQVAVKRTFSDKTAGTEKVLGLDLLSIEPLEGALFLQQDFLTDEGVAALQNALGEEQKVDVVLSDMAPSSCGHKKTDHLRILTMAEAAFDFACFFLCPGGAFITKTLQGGTEISLLKALKHSFQKVSHAKPKASRKESAELYLVALGFRGRAEEISQEELEA